MTRTPAEPWDDRLHHSVPGTDAEMFIQWKGTDVCLDFRCPCGATGHLDGLFAYFVHCPGCDAVFQLGTQVIALRMPDDFQLGTQVIALRMPDDVQPEERAKTIEIR